MAQPFIFGGNTKMSYEDIQRKRAIAEQLLQANSSTPRNVGEGLTSIGRALAYRSLDKKAGKADEANRSASKATTDALMAGIFGSMGGASPEPASYQPPADPNNPQSIANDAMSVLGNFGSLEAANGLPTGYLARTYQIESGGNPNAQNPNSSAGGGFQFIDSTAKQYGLTDKTDLGASAAAAARLAADNAKVLRGVLGREPTAGELYLAHQQGAGGAAKLLSNPNARAVDIVGPDAIRLNGGNENMSAGEFASLWLNKYGGGKPAQPAQGPQAGPETMQKIMQALSDPYTSGADKAVLTTMLDRLMSQNDPMTQMKLEEMRLKLEAAKKTGGVDLPSGALELQWRAGQAGLKPGTPEYQDFILNGGGDPATYRALDMQAQAAGYAPGTPEYQRFMASRGAGDKVTQENLANIETGGEAAAVKAAGTVEGTARGEANVAKGGAAATADAVSKKIDALIADPYLPNMLGPIDSRMPNTTTDAARVQAKIDQLKGDAFLQARQMLKGGGAITDFEGQKAEAAMARMNEAQSVEDYTAALRDFQEAVRAGAAKIDALASGGAGAPSSAPAPNADEELFRKYGIGQ